VAGFELERSGRTPRAAHRHRAAHPARRPSTCLEAEVWVRRDAESLGANAKYLVENTKRCPNPACGVRIQRTEGVSVTERGGGWLSAEFRGTRAMRVCVSAGAVQQGHLPQLQPGLLLELPALPLPVGARLPTPGEAGQRRGCCHCYTAFARPCAGVELQHGARSVQVHRRRARDEGAAAPPPHPHSPLTHSLPAPPTMQMFAWYFERAGERRAGPHALEGARPPPSR
jgi:hypothetical protein